MRLPAGVRHKIPPQLPYAGWGQAPQRHRGSAERVRCHPGRSQGRCAGAGGAGPERWRGRRRKPSGAAGAAEGAVGGTGGTAGQGAGGHEEQGAERPAQGGIGWEAGHPGADCGAGAGWGTAGRPGVQAAGDGGMAGSAAPVLHRVRWHPHPQVRGAGHSGGRGDYPGQDPGCRDRNRAETVLK